MDFARNILTISLSLGLTKDNIHVKLGFIEILKIGLLIIISSMELA